ETHILEGLRLAGRFYQTIPPDENGRVWSEQLGVSLGLWQGTFDGRTEDWLRLFRADGSPVPTRAEAESLRADAERQRTEAERRRADTERKRADAAEAELARLRA